MPSVNKIELMGNLGQDPEIRYFPDGTPAAKISLAVSETWTDKNTSQKQERTEWFTVLFRNKLAETVGRYLHKGDTLLVWGRIQSRQFTDKTRAARTVWEVHAHEMQIIRTKDAAPPAAVPNAHPFDDDGEVRNTSACNPYPSKTAKAACTFYERAGCFFSHFIET